MTIPSPVEENQIMASYEDGVLEVRIPIPGETAAASRKIPLACANASTTAGTDTEEAPPAGQIQAGRVSKIPGSPWRGLAMAFRPEGRGAQRG